MITHNFQKTHALREVPARWIGRIYPSGTFACGRIPPPKEHHHYNPALLDFKRKICITRVYSGDGYVSTDSARVYFQHRHTGRVMGHSSPNPNEILEIHRRRVLSSETTPEGLTNTQGDDTQSSLGLGECENSRALGLSTVPSSRIRSRQGSKGITANGRKWVREGCYTLTHIYGRKNLGFHTLTLPHRGESLRRIVKYWHKIVHRYFEELGRVYERKGIPLQYVSVVEIQEKRYINTGEIAPHLHYVCNARLGGKFILSPVDVRQIFQRVCERYEHWEGGYASCENCQVVRRDAGKYLSKYFSKGGAVVRDIAEKSPELLPRRWWKVSPSVMQSVKADTITVFDAECWNFIYFAQSLAATGFAEYTCEEVYIELSGGFEMLVGYRGKVQGKYEGTRTY